MLYLQMPQNRYSIARTLLLSGKIKTLSELLDIVGKTAFARDSETTPERFNRLLRNLARVNLLDIANMARVLGTEETHIFNLFHAEYVKQRKQAELIKQRRLRKN